MIETLKRITTEMIESEEVGEFHLSLWDKKVTEAELRRAAHDPAFAHVTSLSCRALADDQEPQRFFADWMRIVDVVCEEGAFPALVDLEANQSDWEAESIYYRVKYMRPEIYVEL